MNKLNCEQNFNQGFLLLRFWVQPGAKTSEWAGNHGERIKVRLRARPVEGQANRELIRFLSKNLKLPESKIQITAGLASRGKTVRIEVGSDKKKFELLCRMLNQSQGSND